MSYKIGANVIDHFETVLEKLRRAVQKLSRWGYREVHVVTDHGFLLFQAAPTEPKVPFPADAALLLDARYAFVREGVPVQHLTLPFTFEPSLWVAFPRGIRCFKTAGEYMHGGLTLQEVVIPHGRRVSQFTLAISCRWMSTPSC
ncbi:MAG: hypothetical protein HY347_03300 [candidate division NC10 bacterium]|nr:hypothetical protein [candidate division NC10 bacterium]